MKKLLSLFLLTLILSLTFTSRANVVCALSGNSEYGPDGTSKHALISPPYGCEIEQDSSSKKLIITTLSWRHRDAILSKGKILFKSPLNPDSSPFDESIEHDKIISAGEDSDSQGYYHLYVDADYIANNIYTGMYWVSLEVEGYETATMHVNITNGKDKINFEQDEKVYIYENGDNEYLEEFDCRYITIEEYNAGYYLGSIYQVCVTNPNDPTDYYCYLDPKNNSDRFFADTGFESGLFVDISGFGIQDGEVKVIVKSYMYPTITKNIQLKNQTSRRVIFGATEGVVLDNDGLGIDSSGVLDWENKAKIVKNSDHYVLPEFREVFPVGEFSIPDGKEFAGWKINNEENIKLSGEEIAIKKEEGVLSIGLSHEGDFIEYTTQIIAQWKDIPTPKHTLEEQINNTAGEVHVAKAQNNGLGAKLDSSNCESLLSEAEKATGATVWMEADAIDSKDQSYKQLERAIALEASDNGGLLKCLEINLFKKVGKNNAEKIGETNQGSKAKISLDLTGETELINKAEKGQLCVYYIHEGKTKKIDSSTYSYNSNTHVFTFEANEFSVYGLGYMEIQNNGGGSNSSNTTNAYKSPKTGIE